MFFTCGIVQLKHGVRCRMLYNVFLTLIARNQYSFSSYLDFRPAEI